MINIPMKSSAPLNRQTILSVNQQNVQGAKNTQNITSINTGQQAMNPNTSFSQRTFAPGQSTNPPPVSPSAVTAQPIPPLKNPVRKGQKAPLETIGTLSKIQVRLGWNVTNPDCDVDVSAFLLNHTGKVIGDNWFVFYGQRTSPDRSTTFSIDQGSDKEIITIDFNQLNPNVSKIVFVLTINEALEKHLNFSMLSDAYIRIMDGNSNRELVSFKMDEYYSNVTSMMIGEIYEYNHAWKFNAVGNGVAKDLAGLCELYGVQVIS